MGRQPAEVIRRPEVAAGAEQMIASVFATGRPTAPVEMRRGTTTAPFWSAPIPS